MLVDKQNELMSDLLFTVHQHGGDDVTWKPPIERACWYTVVYDVTIELHLFVVITRKELLIIQF